jgi:2'-5' RNA ligase
MRKCIYLLPEHPQLERIEQLRSRFDPAYELVPAHITLVFPFVSPVNDLYLFDLMDEIAVQFDPIEFSLGPLVCVDSYGFLPVTKGRRLITEMHDKLYGGELKPCLSGEYPYMPHITIGRYFSPREGEELRRASEQAQIVQNGFTEKMVLETIPNEGRSWVDHTVRVKQPRKSDLDWLQTL